MTAKTNAVKEILSINNQQYVIGTNATGIISINGNQYIIEKDS